MIPGTKVTSGTGRRGEVVEAKMDAGYAVFTIEWLEGRSNRRVPYTTEDVLRERDYNQGVVTLEEAKKTMGVFLLTTLCIINVQVYRFIVKDSKVENVYDPSFLIGAKSTGIKAGRLHAWEETQKAKAVDMLMQNEVNLLKTPEDLGLLAEMEAENSCFELTGLRGLNDCWIRMIENFGLSLAREANLRAGGGESVASLHDEKKVGAGSGLSFRYRYTFSCHVIREWKRSALCAIVGGYV